MNDIRLSRSGIVFFKSGAKTIPIKIDPPTQIDENTK
jgi:hypothetical protein